jgi:phosphatidylserine/phosphatidylglycerophosphate/cardiolipin synthase-like enzyme
MRLFFVFFLLLNVSFADRYFFVSPKEGARAEAAIVAQIGKAKSEIRIAMYSFTNGSIANALKAAAKRGVKITLVVDEKTLRGNLKDSRAGELAKLRNITVMIARGDKAKSGNYFGIMHMKVGIIDEKISIYGSANWTNAAFNINHEILFIDDDPKLAKELRNALAPIFNGAKDY